MMSSTAKWMYYLMAVMAKYDINYWLLKPSLIHKLDVQLTSKH